jgi:hypothetical protein
VFSFQILSPMAKGLFHKAIMESGVAIIPYLRNLDDKLSEDVGILLAPLLSQEWMWSEAYRLLSLHMFGFLYWAHPDNSYWPNGNLVLW